MTIAKDRKVLITGGASGFGLDIARTLKRHGAHLALLDVHEERLGEAAAELDAVPIRVDVRNVQEVHDGVAAAATALGGLDTLVAAAGVVHIKPMAEVSEADWDLTLDVNLKGAFFVCQAAVPHIAASGRGRIVTISSDCGRRGFPWQQAYCASKFGLVGLTESIAAELAPMQTTVNCICPVGCPTTGMGQDVLDWKVGQARERPEHILAKAAAGNPVGRNATESDITQTTLFLISEESSFLTGVSLDVDGGAHLGALPGVDLGASTLGATSSGRHSAAA